MDSSDELITDDLPFCFKRGTDQRAVTCRAKLQTRRCKLNQEINKELRLRAGAENLYKATINRKMKDTIALELSFVNSNLQLLKEKLSELNSSVEVYQHESVESVMPMIPLGLKETKEVNFMEPFSDFILEHYSEPSEAFQDAIADIADTRQAARTPSRDLNGLAVLFKYYNLLYYVERRFFPPDRTLGIYFEWYDSLTGVPSCQRTVAFEKACILFNLGGVYTQIGTKQDRRTESGLDAAVENFLRAAGVFKHILETFTNAPSMDLKPQVLQIIVSLMLAQARECLFEKLLVQLETHDIDDDYHIHKDLSREAALLMSEYHELNAFVRSDDIQSYIPECWTGFVPLKSEYYKALAHYHASKSICCGSDDSLTARREDDNSVDISSGSQHDMSLEELSHSDPQTAAAIKMAHIKESLACHEETQRLQRMCRDLRNKISLSKMLNESYLRAVCEAETLEQTAPIDTIIDSDSIDLNIPASSKFTLSLIGPDFTANKVNDPFQKLGPIAIFSARRHWTAPRSIRLQKGSTNVIECRLHNNGVTKRVAPGFRHDQSNNGVPCSCPKDNRTAATSNSAEYGFHMRGDAPVIVCGVDANSLADLGGIKEGDFIVELDGIDVKWYTNVQIATLIQASGSSLDLKVITPMDRNYLKSISSSSKQSNGSSSVGGGGGGGGGSISARSLGSSSGVSSGTSSPVGTSSSGKTKLRGTKSSKGRLSTLSTSWNPFRRTQSLGKIF